MRMTWLDWAVVVGFFLLNLAIGLWYGRRASKSLGEFFLSGRDVPWWLAGTSMVATTFGADTPLAVTGMVIQHGIAGNWLWWNAVASGILTVFFFAALWRRAGVMTDVELIEKRYGGERASGLRAFRALYLAVPMNCIIIGWVNLAMAKILSVTLNVDRVMAVGVCMLLTGLYVSVSGLWGVLVTDMIQFVVKLAMTIILAIVAVRAAGGIAHIRDTLPAEKLEFIPSAGSKWMPLSSFAVFVGVQWWASWYPGAEPGGGGYVALRIFSARTERDGVLATLWFNVAHYAVRSWPWILTALSALVLYPPETLAKDPERAYVTVMVDHLPPSLRGLMMAGFLAAYMSTVATHLNWGASYLVGDLYKRFLRPNAPEGEYVMASRVATGITLVIAGGVSLMLDSIEGAWKVLLALGAGTGPVLILRWYWWRINAWSEIVAMLGSLLSACVLHWVVGIAWDAPAMMVGTMLCCTAAWLTATFVTRPESDKTLDQFYRDVRPDGPGWGPVAARCGPIEHGAGIPVRLRDWVAGCGLVYGTLFGIGKLLFGQVLLGASLLGFAVLCAAVIAHDLRRSGAIG